MKLLANLVEIGDGPWAVFQPGVLFKFAPRLRLCSLLAPHALLVMGWLSKVAADRRCTSGAGLIGWMGTAADMDGGTIADGDGQRLRCRLAGSSGLIRITSITTACVTEAVTRHTSATFTARRRSSQLRHIMVRIMAATTCRMDIFPPRMETGLRMSGRSTILKVVSRSKTY
jgi:hypothetical protein